MSATTTDKINNNSFHGEITVASRIIDYLSSGLYKDPASCLKELINNSFDADAGHVNVFVKPDANRIIIEDDGEGMNREEFIKHFSRVSESHKRDSTDRTPSGRPKIGKIGIGLIAANELCDVLEIFSTKKGSNQLLHIKIDFKAMREPLEKRRKKTGDIVKADYEGQILRVDTRVHYTHIFLQSVRGPAQNILVSAKAQKEGAKGLTLYGLSAESITRILREHTPNSWKDFDTYSETMIKIALNVPVKYAKGWMPKPMESKVSDLEQSVAKLKFQVFYDGTELRKPIIFSDRVQKRFVKKFEYKGKNVSAKGYFYIQHGTIKPIELHGLLVRIRNAAVGEYDPQFWGFSPTDASLIQRWVSAEIWADDRLEEAMNIDRRTLRDVHPAYVELREKVHKELRNVLKDARAKIYEAGSKERRVLEVQKMIGEIKELANKEISPLSSAAARDLLIEWDKSLNKGRNVKEQSLNKQHLLKKYSVIELYEIVIDVAKEVLEPGQLRKFLKLLTERLIR